MAPAALSCVSVPGDRIRGRVSRLLSLCRVRLSLRDGELERSSKMKKYIFKHWLWPSVSQSFPSFFRERAPRSHNAGSPGLALRDLSHPLPEDSVPPRALRRQRVYESRARGGDAVFLPQLSGELALGAHTHPWILRQIPEESNSISASGPLRRLGRPCTVRADV